jgi:hypothetical protein
VLLEHTQVQDNFLANRLREAAPIRAQGTYAWLQGKPARAKKWWRKSLRTAEAQGTRWDLGMTHCEMGRRLGDVAHLEQAVTILTDLGATVDADNARLLLRQVRLP